MQDPTLSKTTPWHDGEVRFVAALSTETKCGVIDAREVPP